MDRFNDLLCDRIDVLVLLNGGDDLAEVVPVDDELHRHRCEVVGVALVTDALDELGAFHQLHPELR